MHPLALRVNAMWVLVGNVVYTACQWGIIVVLARLGNQQQVGEYTLALAITAPVFLLFGLQLNSVVATDVLHSHPFAQYLQIRAATILLCIVVVSAIVVVTRNPAVTTATIVVVAAMKSLDAVSDVFAGLLQQRERMDRVALALIVNGGTSVLLVVAGAVVTRSVVVVAICSALGSAIGLFAVAMPAGIGLWRRLERIPLIAQTFALSTLRSTLPLVKSALPLGIVMFLISINTNIPRYVIAGKLGEDQVGIYSALAYTLVGISTVVLALGQAATPRLANYFATGDRRRFIVLQLRLVGFGLAFGALTLTLVALIGRPLLELIYGRAYSATGNLFLLMAGSSAVSFVGSFLGYGMTATRLFRLQVPVFLASTAVNLIGCAALIPNHGLQGAAWATIAAGTVQLSASALALLALLRRQADVPSVVSPQPDQKAVADS